MNNGTLILSLDYELMWGCLEWSTPEAYGKTHVARVPVVIERILELLKKYEVKATFATVGMIMLANKQEALNSLPELVPSYEKQSCSPYENNYIQMVSEQEESLYFSPQTVELLKKNPFVEIGTHTYCHYYCDERGQTIEQFEADLKKAIEVAHRKGCPIKSIVFPKNQVREEYLKVCSEHGLICYRGNAKHFFSRPKSRFEGLKNRISRLLDTYIKISKPSSMPYANIEQIHGMINVQASRMLRPYNSKLALLEPLKIKRICDEIRYAAQNKELYHLWWHPHNFGNNVDENIAMLEKILQVYKKCHDQYGMKSYSMLDFANQIKNS